MNPMLAFNLGLSRIQQMGYQKSVAFTAPAWNVPHGLPISRGAALQSRGGKERSGCAAQQVHRTNRQDATPARVKKNARDSRKWRSRAFYASVEAQLALPMRES